MAHVARGHVSDRPFTRTIYTVGAKQFTGELALTQAGTTCRVAWQRGRITAVEAPGAAGGLAQRAGAIFALPDATFVLDDQSALAPVAGEAPIDPRRLIFQGVADHYDSVRLQRELEPVEKQRFRISPDAVSALSSYGFAPGDQPAIKRLLERDWTLPALLEAVTELDPRRTLAIVAALLATDALAKTGEQPSAVTPAPVPVPAPAPVPSAVPASARTPAAPGRPAAQPAPSSAPSPMAPSSPRPAATGGAPAAPMSAAAAELAALVAAKSKLSGENADHFALLGLARDANEGAIRAAYLGLAKQLHPDRVSSIGVPDLVGPAQQVFARLNEAFQVVSDAKRRAEYLQRLSLGHTDADDERAVEKMKAILEAEERLQLGEMALRRGHWSQALEDFEAALAANPEEGEAYALAAWARWNDAPRKDEIRTTVKREFRRALRMAPNSINAFYFRGRLARQEEDLEAAAYCFRRVLTLDSKHNEALDQYRKVQAAMAEREAAKKRGGRKRD